MPFGAIPLGLDARIRVGAASPPTLLVGGLNRYSNPRTRPTNTRKYYNAMPSVTIVGDTEDSFELSGDYAGGDDGQTFLFDSYESKALIFVEILPDGTNGIRQQGRVSRAEHGGPGVDEPPSASFQVARAADPTFVGNGLG